MISKEYIRRAFRGLRALEQRPEEQQDMMLFYIHGVVNGAGLVDVRLLDRFPDRKDCLRRLSDLMRSLVYSMCRIDLPCESKERALHIICKALICVE